MERKVEYIIRHIDTKEPIIRCKSEMDAVNWAGKMNKRAGREKVEILKRIITVKTSIL